MKNDSSQISNEAFLNKNVGDAEKSIIGQNAERSKTEENYVDMKRGKAIKLICIWNFVSICNFVILVKYP